MDEPLADDPECAATRAELCRLAVGLEPPDPRVVTHHVRGCAGCRDFVDELAEVRGWLDGISVDRVAETPDARTLADRARRALGAELAARFARDLLAVVEGKAPRPRDVRERDRERLALVLDDDALDRSPWPEVFAAIDVPPHSLRARARALDVAVALDPVGLDIGLSHIATLVRVGDVARADAEADRWTGLV